MTWEENLKDAEYFLKSHTIQDVLVINYRPHSQAAR